MMISQYITEQDWIEGGDPQFTDHAGLLSDTTIAHLVNWSIDAASDPGQIMTHWTERSLNDFFHFPDWPVLPDLSYSNSEYLTAAIGDLPLGDLNWFPEAKAEWLDRREELDGILYEMRGEIVVSAYDDGSGHRLSI